MITVSLCMIVRDEEDNIADCLKSVGDVADEIVIVDTGSKDQTKAIAREYTANVYDFEWIDDFSAARNFAFSKATMDYILWLDADDRLLGGDRTLFMRLKADLPGDVDAVMMRYNTAFDEAGRPTFSYARERLVRRSAGFLWREPVHEYIAVSGKTIDSNVSVTHAGKGGGPPSGRNIRIYEKVLDTGGQLSPRGLYYYARELREHGRNAEAAERFRQFLADGKGWVEDNIGACLELGRAHLALGDERAALQAFLMSFCFDLPRAEACCCLGYLFKARGEFRRAAFWFETAQRLVKPEGNWGFLRNDDWDYVPCLECAVCHYALGDLDKAEYFNERAGQCKQDSEAVRHNRALFQSIRAERSRA